ncbi:MAG TPA: heparan-alpha-glucosaminide N-acetyltransferase, partial [Candidatus Thermoplasmatota archaeon]|nr:heparan-alpha-glucosaminide N-acetyltransferase [Candidatus Thermoplasmatota archaeon]
GIAIILMIAFHFIYDLNHYKIIYYKLWTGPFAIAASVTASIFVVLVGVSLTIAFNKRKKHVDHSQIYAQFIKRGVKLFGLGLIITLISWIIIPERFVIFGILHCIGVCIILSIPFLRFVKLNLILGSMIVIGGLLLRLMTFDFNYLIPLGFLPPKYFTIDYFPLLPWFGVVLLGIAFGHMLYPDGKRCFHFRDRSSLVLSEKICFIGRHSLLIYFAHQPVLVGIIMVFMFFQ